MAYIAHHASLRLQYLFIWIVVVRHHLVQVARRAMRFQLSIETDGGFAARPQACRRY
jgi:hypothetical protein